MGEYRMKEDLRESMRKKGIMDWGIDSANTSPDHSPYAGVRAKVREDGTIPIRIDKQDDRMEQGPINMDKEGRKRKLRD